MKKSTANQQYFTDLVGRSVNYRMVFDWEIEGMKSLFIPVHVQQLKELNDSIRIKVKTFIPFKSYVNK